MCTPRILAHLSGFLLLTSIFGCGGAPVSGAATSTGAAADAPSAPAEQDVLDSFPAGQLEGFIRAAISDTNDHDELYVLSLTCKAGPARTTATCAIATPANPEPAELAPYLATELVDFLDSQPIRHDAGAWQLTGIDCTGGYDTPARCRFDAAGNIPG